MWRVFLVEQLLLLLLIAGAIWAWIRFNNSSKFEKDVVKKARFKPEEIDAEASTGKSDSPDACVGKKEE